MLPSNYSAWAAANSKDLSVVVSITGVSDLFTSQPSIYRVARYGDAGLTYGQAGLAYGALTKVPGTKDYLSLDQSSLAIQQKIDPEQGAGSVSTLSLAFIDKNMYFTQLCAPGIVVPEILGREVRVFMGMANTSFPEDYFQVFRGYVSGVTQPSGMCILQISDPGFRKRQDIFISQTTTLASAIGTGDTTIPLNDNSAFFKPILNIAGAYDSAVRCFINIDSEYIEYQPTGIGSNTYTGVTRGVSIPNFTYPTVNMAASHSAGASVSNFILIEDDAMSMALKIMLSGWNGPWLSGVALQSINNCIDPNVGTIPGALLLPVGIDAKRDYGLTTGDQIQLTGGSNNGQSVTVSGFSDAFGQTNRVVLTTGTFTTESPTTATAAFRSQFDAYPIDAGCNMTPQDVDVDQHVYLKRNFLGQAYCSYRFLMGGTESGKTFIESEIYLPVGAYAVTRGGRASVAYTKPPLGGNTMVTLDKTNILNPQSIRPVRATNQRRFYNVIAFSYDYDESSAYNTVSNFLDSTSITLIGVTSTLPINSRGLRSDKGAATLVSSRGLQLLNLYKRCASQLEVTVSWAAASAIEIGDPVIVNDDGTLGVANFITGTRNLGSQVWTVLERTLDPKTGNGKLTLLGGSGFQPSDRFASIAPSSVLTGASTASVLTIQDSFGAIFPRQEYLKWAPYVGLRVRVHSTDYSVDGTALFTGFNPANKYQLYVSGLGFTPQAGHVLDLAPYSASSDPNDQKAAKSAHLFWTPKALVTGGTSSTVFAVSDATNIRPGGTIVVHDAGQASRSAEVTVQSVSGTTVTVATPLGFTPANGFIVDILGSAFPDGGAGYRWI